MDEIGRPRGDFPSAEEIVRYLGELRDVLNANFSELEARIEKIKETQNGNEKRKK